MALRIAVIIPVYNGAAYLRVCLEQLSQSSVTPHETIVVDDGSTDSSMQVAKEFGVTVISTGGRRGPAVARNLGANAAQSDLLYFIDSDVCLHRDTIEQVLAHFEEDAALDALIGSYDDSPQCKDFLSQYKNLMHCFVHQRGRREACTFWSGCGAIRRPVFFEHSGFNESYGRPAIEDIELGYRLARAKRKVLLDPDVRVKHLKTWSFFNLVKTDIMDRGIPWTELILRDKRLPNDLNLQLSQRVSVALVFLLVGITCLGAFFMGASLIAPLLAVLFLMLVRYEVRGTLNLRFKATIGTLVLGTSIVGLAFASDNLMLVPPVLLAYLLMFLRHRYSYSVLWKRRLTEVFCGTYLLATIGFALTFLPRQPLVLALLIVLSAIILLNSQFYLFLAAKRGRLFALAAVPFHLLFHFYNGLSFLIGITQFYMRSLLESHKKPITAAPFK
jgi:glycosyltransferase involved in cell wall biosynthesis